jgi:regulator of protease activity HflC (stomatin/prohibitin superfamily)
MGPLSGLAFCVSSVFINEPMQAIVYTAFNKVTGTSTKQGMSCHPCCFQNYYMVDMAIRTTKVETNVPDASGSPINVTVMVNYKVKDPVAASQFIEDVDKFVDTLAFDTVIKVCSLFRYKSAEHAEPSLIDDGHHISAAMVRLLQEKTRIAGTEIIRCDFIEISYSPEVAAALLQV